MCYTHTISSKDIGRRFEKILYCGDKYFIGEMSYYDKKEGKWKHTLSICNIKDKKNTDVIPEI